MRGTHTPKGYRRLVAGDIDLLPLMNVFVALVPMLLLSAVFLRIAVIKLGLPGEVTASPASPAGEILVQLESDRYVVLATAPAPAIFEAGVGGGTASTPEVRIVTRNAEGSAQLTSELRALVGDRAAEYTVVIAATDAERYEELITVMDAARAAGIAQLSLFGAEPDARGEP